MRYWIHLDNKTEGPFSPEQLSRIAGFTADTLTCPEDAKDSSAWTSAKARPELQDMLRKLPKRYWILDNTKTPKGPFDIQELRKLRGLEPGTLACPVGSQKAEDWKPAGSIEDLKALFAPPEPIEPQPAHQKTQPAPAPVPVDIGPSPQQAPPPKKSQQVQEEALARKPAGQPVLILPKQVIETAPRQRVNKRLFLLIPAIAAAAGGVYGVHQHLTKKAKRTVQAAAATGPSSNGSPPIQPAAKTSGSNEAIDFVKNYPIQKTASRLVPYNLYQLGDIDQKRWKSTKMLGDRFRYEPFFLCWDFTQSLAGSRGISSEEAARLVRIKVEDWHGLDAIYRVDWSAIHQGGARYRVEIKVTDDLSVLLRQTFMDTANPSGPSALPAPTEVHAFQIDLTDKTLVPVTPAAEKDLKPLPPPIKQPAPRKRKRLKPPTPVRAKREPPPEQRETPPEESEVATPEPAAQDQPPQEPEETSQVPVSGDKPAASPASGSSAEEPPPAQEPAPARSPASVPVTTTSPPSTPAPTTELPAGTAPPKVKPATEMSVEELEQYLKRK